MATVFPGNAIPAPGMYGGDISVDDELLYSAHGYIQKGVTLAPAQGVLLLGTLLKQDPATKKYVKAATAADAVGILRKSVDTGGAGTEISYMGNILYAGLLKLGALKAANSGVTFDSSVLGGRSNEIEGFFKF